MLTKSLLARQVAKGAGLTIAKSNQVVASVLASIQSSLADGEEVRLTGFGSFKVRQTKARTARNPRTRQPIRVAASRRVSFSAGSNLVQAVRGKK